MPDTQTKERRSFKREDLNSMILFRRDGGSGSYRSGYLRNISDGGILFETAEPLLEGEKVALFFKEKNSYADTRVNAEVVRSEQLSDGFSIGARFL